MKIYGDVESLKASVIEELEMLYDLHFHSDEFVPIEAVEKLCHITAIINKEVAIYLNRRGGVEQVCVGDSNTIVLPKFEGRRDKNRLSGVRCIHTHPNGVANLSDIDISSLQSMKFDAIISIGVFEGKVTGVFAGVLLQKDGEYNDYEIHGPINLDNETNRYFMKYIDDNDKALAGMGVNLSTDAERVILVGICDSEDYFNDISLDELAELAKTAGADVLAKVVQKRSAQDAATFIGKGKVHDLALRRQALNADLIIFNDELTGSQVRNLEDMVGARVIDRTMLILDIFAKHARTKEGKLQVELAQLKYTLPRLMGLGNVLSRLGGGIGTRGPGEKQLETDRRHIRRKIKYCENEISKIAKNRGTLRSGRKSKGIPCISVVGYTNAGKSTLLNSLCKSDVLVEDKLFATLDPTSRGLKLPDGREVILIDTVGFIKKLPHQLVESFKSTLEEVVHADLLLHIVDVTSPNFEEQIQVVNCLLNEIGAGDKKIILVFNKADKLESQDNVRKVFFETGGSVFISAKTGYGLEKLLEKIGEMLERNQRKVEISADFSEGWIYPYVCDHGTVIEANYDSEGVKIKAIIDSDKLKRIERWIVDETDHIGE